jgi:hypothetical protein
VPEPSGSGGWYGEITMRTSANALSLTVAVIVAGCATTQEAPEAYAWAPVRPPAVPGTGLPTRGQPGQVGPEAEPLPRSPHKRLLPPTREPGLWAGDAPRASAEAEPTPALVGVLLPYPPEAHTVEEREPTMRCAQSLYDAARAVDMVAPLRKLSERQRRCVVAQLYSACAGSLLAEVEFLRREAREFDAAELRTLKAMKEAAAKFAQAECAGVPWDYGASDIISNVTSEWAKERHR